MSISLARDEQLGQIRVVHCRCYRKFALMLVFCLIRVCRSSAADSNSSTPGLIGEAEDRSASRKTSPWRHTWIPPAPAAIQGTDGNSAVLVPTVQLSGREENGRPKTNGQALEHWQFLPDEQQRRLKISPGTLTLIDKHISGISPTLPSDLAMHPLMLYS